MPSTTTSDTTPTIDPTAPIFDLCVIGGGVVGAAVCRAAACYHDCTVCLIEREGDLMHWASGSNSGILCTGYDAATLERALIRDSIRQVPSFYRQMNLPARFCGSLVCQWPQVDGSATSTASSSAADLLHTAGDADAKLLTPTDLQSLEPFLSSDCLGAVHIPGEVVVDPWLHGIALIVHARQNGAQIYTNFAFDPQQSYLDKNDRIWNIVSTDKRQKLRARAVVSATGIWAATIQNQVFSHAQWKAQPRRGQYRVYDASEEKSLLTHPIQPIPTDRTKGVMVFSTLYDQIVVGPTAQDQESLTDRDVCRETARELTRTAKNILPHLDTDAVVGDYVGIRPGSDHRDYQMHCDAKHQWMVCASIRSTGLTASLGIGRHVLQTLQKAGILEAKSKRALVTRPLPPVYVLAREYRESGADESVTIDGHKYRVTHPLTKWGFASGKGFAADHRKDD
jgi:glycerol-3-phosphate dehydrogenase